MQEVFFNYEGKRFVVVGASSGIGRQIAFELAQAGATVLCLARRIELIEQIDVKNCRGKIIPAFSDVTKCSSGEWDEILKKFVGDYGKINGAVYTAGVAGLTSIRAWDEELSQRIMNTSYWGIPSVGDQKTLFRGRLVVRCIFFRCGLCQLLGAFGLFFDQISCSNRRQKYRKRNKCSSKSNKQHKSRLVDRYGNDRRKV